MKEQREIVEKFLAAWGGAGFPKVVKKHLDAFFAGQAPDAVDRHPAGCVVRLSPLTSDHPTCCFLADGTKKAVCPECEGRGAVSAQGSVQDGNIIVPCAACDGRGVVR